MVCGAWPLRARCVGCMSFNTRQATCELSLHGGLVTRGERHCWQRKEGRAARRTGGKMSE